MPNIVDSPSIVHDKAHVSHAHSTFVLKEPRLTTEIFGYIKPHVCLDVVSSDRFSFRPNYSTESYSLKAPFMQDVHRKLSYIHVPLSAILPLNFEKVFTNPVQGDDVQINVGCSVANGFYNLVTTFLTLFGSYLSDLNGANKFTSSHLNGFMKTMIFGELWFSRGSLLSSLGAHVSKRVYFLADSGDIYSFDRVFDLFMERLNTYFTQNSLTHFVLTTGSQTYNVRVGSYDSVVGLEYISLREALDIMRDGADWDITALSGVNPTPAADFKFSYTGGSRGVNNVPFNIGRLWAYQLAVAQFFTNDHVDHIYSAELYRQYIRSLLKTMNHGASSATFTYNGMTYLYDEMSAFAFSQSLTTLNNGPDKLVNNAAFLQYFISLAGYRRSLRYMDYFVSGRVRPLAVGDVSVSVNSNSVSVVDVTQKIQVQRFLNAINTAGRSLSNYVKTLFGAEISPDRHQPYWLANIDELVYTSRVENTGDAQMGDPNSITARFTANSSNKEITCNFDLPGYFIGLTSYDIERSYIDSIDRSFFVRDRFDMFVPELQYVGDQPLYAHELQCYDNRTFGTAFAYQFRDMQFKLAYPVADGGFIEYLPGYAYMFRNYAWQTANISPDFIRSKPFELDEFFIALPGYSLASRFHFISRIINNTSASRPMVAHPKILS